MKIALSHHHYVGGVRIWDTESGNSHKSGEYKWGETGVFGSCWRQRRKWFAFYASEGEMIFQIGARKWKVSRQNSAAVCGNVLRQFTIRSRGHEDFSIRYLFRGLFPALIDPTYDLLEEETDDFFLFVANFWKSPPPSFEVQSEIPE